ncbi:TPA: PglZ domain-containing protein, partial [bacterium]|nr:PglZ domain-containing protein [bacterium]
PLISILPSTTEWARKSLFAGVFPRDFQSSDENELFRNAIENQEIIQIKTYGEAPAQRDSMLSFLEDNNQIKAIVFNLIDIKLHSTIQNLVTLYEEVQVNFENTIQPYLEKIPSDSLVFILSDHGFVDLDGKGIIAPDKNQADLHRRYVGLRSFSNPNNFSSSDFVFFSSENIKMPSDNDIMKYAFVRSGNYITSAKEQESGRTVRYAHGGVSMQEMIIPCAIFAPKSQGQLTMF